MSEICKNTIEVKLTPLISHLVFKIFRNCRISENCINLSALRNLKPTTQRGRQIRNKRGINEVRIFSQSRHISKEEAKTGKVERFLEEFGAAPQKLALFSSSKCR